MKLWLVMVVFTISSLLSISSVLVGYKLETRVVMRYLKGGGNSYIDSVVDRTRSLRLRLAGTRCFGTFPYAAYLTAYRAGDTSWSSYGGWELISQQVEAEALVVHLDCRE